MRIALVHSVYSDEGLSGENVTVAEQAELLRDAGHDVFVVARRTLEESEKPLYSVQAAWRVASGRGGDPTAELRDFAPDVVHIHNLFPNFGTAWLDEWPGPMVATLHNYRYACANGLLLRDGHTCLDCPTGSSWSAIAHACYRGSRLATIPLAISTRRGAAGSPVVRRADRLVAVAEHSRDLFVQFGLNPTRIDVVPHGMVARFNAATPGPPEPRFLVAGRLSPEKGVDRLLRMWPEGALLDVIGDGPQAGVIEGLAPQGVRLMGAQSTTWRDTARNYTAVIAPGPAIEAFPLVVVEAWEAGLPVIALDGGGVAQAVRSTGAGAVYRDSESLASAMRGVEEQGPSLRSTARAAYDVRHTPESWISSIEAVYDSAIALRAG